MLLHFNPPPLSLSRRALPPQSCSLLLLAFSPLMSWGVFPLIQYQPETLPIQFQDGHSFECFILITVATDQHPCSGALRVGPKTSLETHRLAWQRYFHLWRCCGNNCHFPLQFTFFVIPLRLVSVSVGAKTVFTLAF